LAGSPAPHRIAALDPNEVRAKAAAKSSEPFRFAGTPEPEAVTGVIVEADGGKEFAPRRTVFDGDLH
jgi:hypothetical protein